jgi:threonyl-tRNA synthetase
MAITLKKQGYRVECDLRNEKIGFKIREHTLQRIPYLLVAGDREVESSSIAVRAQGGKDLGSMPVNQFVSDFLETSSSTDG